ncbi:MAG: hypothetical protein ACKVQQ_06190 [Burkholderiales bacterium]
MIDTVNGNEAGKGVTTASRRADMVVSGWAVDPRDESIPGKAWIQMSAVDSAMHGVIAELKRNLPRPDVAAAFKNPSFVGAGFRLPIAVSALPAGDYIIAIVQQVGADVLVCQATVRVMLE